jgi:hypothetical protein
LVICLPLFNVKVTGNSMILLRSIFNVGKYQLLNTDDLFFDLPDTDLPSDQFTDLGFNSTFFIKNMGCLFFLGIALLIAYIVLFVLKAVDLKKPAYRKARNVLERAIIWNSLTDYMYVAYFVLALSILLNFKQGINWDNNLATTSNVFLIIGSLMVVVWPIWMGKFLKTNYKKGGYRKIK